jgi:hypothetical protein
MILSYIHQFIFIKTRKTASTSMEIALSEHCYSPDIITRINEEYLRNIETTFHKKRGWYNHMPMTEVRDIITGRTFKTFFKFAMERHPYDKAVSQIYWRTANNPSKSSINDIIEKGEYKNIHLYTDGKDVLVDKIFRYEDLPDCLTEIEQAIGIPIAKDFPHAKKSRPRAGTDDILTEEHKRIIQDICQAEFELLNYTP